MSAFQIQEIAISTKEFRLFQSLVYDLCGIHLTDVKRQLVKSRLLKRLRALGMDSYRDYYDFVIAQGPSSDELTTLVNCITTNKTDFLRERHHFDFVAESLVPKLLEDVRLGRAPRRLRVWHAGCSSGEEPYSLAMTLLDALKGAAHWDIRLLASDIDTNVLAQAEEGLYHEDRLGPLPNAWIAKYFQRGHGDQRGFMKVRSQVKDLVTFRKINLRDDEWPIRSDVQFDLIFCRNVVIYFDKPTQTQLFARFAGKMRPGGHLFIGHSESLFNTSRDFLPIGSTIYQLSPAYSQSIQETLQ